ncbi:MAG: ABC transporter ATP-binding protein [Clostridia bacterium]|nr:ABC transporter ATP-binding protein [Clostridia bacterium]
MKLEINHIKKSFGKKQVLRDISLTAEKGECIGILGANGSGKSTLLTILAGVQKAGGGEFLLNGENLFKNSSLRSKTVGYVPQGTPLIDELTAYDNLLLWYSKKELKAELENGILKLLGINEFIKVPVRKMSGGMKKRLSIGCAVAKKPPVLLLDEPTAALDIACRQDIAEYLKGYKAAGGILFLTTHDPLELELCDRLFIIKEGLLTPFEFDGNLQKLVESL